MIEQEQIDFIINHQMFYPAVGLVGFVFILFVLKFLMGSRATDSRSSLEDDPKSNSGKRKKGKKQKASQEKKQSSDSSPKSKKVSRKNEVDSLFETGNKRNLEEGNIPDKKRDGKSKSKSKKKKSQTQSSKIENTMIESQPMDAMFDSGEWKTVSTKEQREQQKREKRKLEEDVAVAVETADKASLVPLVQPVYKPTPNISAIAKGIAPRFARAAGETWQEKPAVQPVLPLQSKRPMPPATIPGTSKQSSKGNTVNQGWSPGSQGKSYWPGDIGTTWPNSTQSATSITNDLIGISWPPSDTTSSLLSMTTSGGKGSMPGWPQGGSTWQTTDEMHTLEQYNNMRKTYPTPSPTSLSPNLVQDQSSSSTHSSCSDDVFTPHPTVHRTPYFAHSHPFHSEPTSLFQQYGFSTKGIFGTATSTSMTWDIHTEDWVHVNNGQNGRTLDTNADWASGDSPIRTQTTVTTQKVEEWTLEPEGFPINPPQLDPNDPWNLEVIENEGNGDWSAPVSSWDNTNEEWKAPVPVKTTPSYIYESSDEEKSSAKIISFSHQQNSSNIVTGSSSPQAAIVGAGPEFMNQATGQGQSKKSRRRRKKKTTSNEPEQTSSPTQQSIPEIETPKIETTEKKDLKSELDTKPESPDKTTVQDIKEKTLEEAKEDWSVPKASKKRKSKARKAD
uniref:uncharacterized protein LOC120346739 isoform X1 n=1 Tax=Styela clava TaxID=7725 RepID=UPI001939EFC9|nr:uncharacterized protein LOC120346739 isoform X1 [Styela clava]